MSIYKEGGYWRADVYVDGKRVKIKKGFLNKKEAKEWLNQQIITHKDLTNQKNFIDCKKILFDDLLIKFEEIHLKSISLSTSRRYLVDLEYRIKPFFRGVFLNNVNPLLIEDFKVKLMSKLSPKSVSNCIGLLKTILKKGVAWEMIEEDPSKNIKMPKIHRQPYAWWENKNDIAKFLEYSKNDPYYLAYFLALHCGMRLGEIVGLSKGDINLEVGYILIHKQWLEKEKCYGPPKHGKNRYIRFSKNSELFELLSKAVAYDPENEVIFLTKSGKRLSGRKLSGVYFQKIIEATGVPKIRFHDLRHTFASWYMIEKDNIWDLKAILGHADISTTQRYAHVSSKGASIPIFKWKQEHN